MTIVAIFFLYQLIALLTKHYFNIDIFNLGDIKTYEAHFLIILSSTAFLLFGLIVTFAANVIYIDTFNKTISIKNVITQKYKQYSFHELDGYFDSIQRNGYASYKIVMINKNGKRVIKISSFYYSNYVDLKEGLDNLPYLGNE